MVIIIRVAIQRMHSDIEIVRPCHQNPGVPEDFNIAFLAPEDGEMSSTAVFVP